MVYKLMVVIFEKKMGEIPKNANNIFLTVLGEKLTLKPLVSKNYFLGFID